LANLHVCLIIDHLIFSPEMKKKLNLAVLLCLFAGAMFSLEAQTAVPPPTPNYQPLSDQQLDQLLGPIALYPDPLIAQILPASTLPTEIVLADRYVSGGGDPNQIAAQPWDASVQAVAHYPNVLKWLDDNLNWTTELGQAFINQQPDVMNSIQRLRASAQNLGNLQTTQQQQVIDDGGDIEIVPANPDEIYVPIYQPDTVYYQSAIGAPFITFGVGFGIGAWLNCDFDWGHRNLIVWDRDHPRPANWWHERGGQRTAAFARNTTVWRPVNRPTFVGSDRGDRGWNNNPAVRQPTPIASHPEPHPVLVHNNAPEVRVSDNHFDNAPRPAPAPVEHFDSAPRPVTGSAFIGIQSSQDTRNFSNRGQQSMQTITHSAPIEHSAPAAHPASSSGGGGGNHSAGASRH
jgi:hypothetical protein